MMMWDEKPTLHSTLLKNKQQCIVPYIYNVRTRRISGLDISRWVYA